MKDPIFRMERNRLPLIGATVLIAAIAGASAFGVGRAMRNEDVTIRNAKVIRSGFGLREITPEAEGELALWLAKGLAMKGALSQGEIQVKTLREQQSNLKELAGWPEFLDARARELASAKENRVLAEKLKEKQLNQKMLLDELRSKFIHSTENLQARAAKLPTKEALEKNPPPRSDAQAHLKEVQSARNELGELTKQSKVLEAIKAWAVEQRSQHAELEALLNKALKN